MAPPGLNENDFTDDRLALVLSFLGSGELWEVFETTLSSQLVCWYGLETLMVYVNLATSWRVYLFTVHTIRYVDCNRPFYCITNRDGIHPGLRLAMGLQVW